MCYFLTIVALTPGFWSFCFRMFCFKYLALFLRPMPPFGPTLATFPLAGIAVFTTLKRAWTGTFLAGGPNLVWSGLLFGTPGLAELMRFPVPRRWFNDTLFGGGGFLGFNAALTDGRWDICSASLRFLSEAARTWTGLLSTGLDFASLVNLPLNVNIDFYSFWTWGMLLEM